MYIDHTLHWQEPVCPLDSNRWHLHYFFENYLCSCCSQSSWCSYINLRFKKLHRITCLSFWNVENAGMQSQLVCNGCRTILLYPQGATNVRCAICNTMTPTLPAGSLLPLLIAVFGQILRGMHIMGLFMKYWSLWPSICSAQI